MHDSTKDEYRIKFVQESDLPPDLPWVFIRRDGEMWLAIKVADVCPATLEDCWAAYRAMGDLAAG